MAKSFGSFATFLILLCLCFLLLSTTEMRLAEAKICQRYSKTWSGTCKVTSHCDRQCRNWEDARHGACHEDKRGRACFCYFNCRKKPYNL